MARPLHFATALLALSVALLGCPKKKTDAVDAAADAEPAPAAMPVDSGPATPTASNVNEIARFGDEAKIANEVVTTAAPLTIVRKSPPNGEWVARLAPRTEVTKIASHEGQYLVVFTNPKEPDDHLMGWIAESAFNAVPAVAQKCKADRECPTGSVCIPHEAGTKCEKGCSSTNTRACAQHFACTGEGPNAEGKIVRCCVSTLPQDAGALQSDAGRGAADAGRAPGADAGKTKTK